MTLVVMIIPTLDEAAEDTSPFGLQDDLNQCAFAFTGILDLNSHLESQHKKTNTDDYKCKKCNKIIRTCIGQLRHAELYCEECNVCSAERVSFDIHMGVMHKNVDLFKCERCDKTLEDQGKF